MKPRAHREQGYILMATALAMVAVLGMTGLAIDLGRMYVAKNEAQTYVDAAALRASLELDGTTAGISRAVSTVVSSANRWNFGSGAFAGTQVEFAQAQSGPWEASPASAAGYDFVRVTATAPVPMSFIQVLGQGPTRPVAARAVAGQMPVTDLNSGLFPFSPYAHDPAAPPDFGLIPGQVYTLRWAASPKLNKPETLCPGDASQTMIDIAEEAGGSERGYIEETSASILRKCVIYDYQTVVRNIGDSVVMTGGAKETIRDAVIERVQQDSNHYSDTYSIYRAAGNGNGRRLVVVPVNAWASGGYRIVQFAAFFLKSDAYYESGKGGNVPICAEYVGPYVQGSTSGGAGNAGYYRIRLVE